MSFWIYESWVHNKAIVHDGTCAYCENGTNRQGEKSARGGSWAGPYKTPHGALEAAVKTRRHVVRGCNHCMAQAA
jgi:hypothetical protein